MRTTITIDDDLFEAAKSIAHSRDQSVGKVLSDLARKGLTRAASYTTRSGMPVFSVGETAPPITPEMVKNAEDEA